MDKELKQFSFQTQSISNSTVVLIFFCLYDFAKIYYKLFLNVYQYFKNLASISRRKKEKVIKWL